MKLHGGEIYKRWRVEYFGVGPGLFRFLPQLYYTYIVYSIVDLCIYIYRHIETWVGTWGAYEAFRNGPPVQRQDVREKKMRGQEQEQQHEDAPSH